MIAAVKGWFAVIAALLFILPGAAMPADYLNGAARELARRTVAYGGKGETVSVACHNASSLTPAALEQVRRAFEAALQEGGLRVAETGALETRLTLSEDQSQFLLIEEIHKGDDRQVWMSSWKHEAAANRGPARITLDRKRIWDQSEQILDALVTESSLLVLSPSNLSLYSKGANGQWQPAQSSPIVSSKPWPRDLRGHLRVTGQNFQVFLPGMTCTSTLDAISSMACRSADEPWLLESGSRGILLANFAAGRNYFDGRVVTQSGLRKTVAAFYSAAAVDDQSRTFWILALLDGRAQIVDGSFEPVATIPGWGSDIAGVDARCGSGSQIMATKATDSTEPDAVQLFAFGNRVASPLAVPVTFSGPVTALWPSGGASVLAVEHDLSGRYSAYVLTVGCGD
jgi:hypothetical protein